MVTPASRCAAVAFPVPTTSSPTRRNLAIPMRARPSTPLALSTSTVTRRGSGGKPTNALSTSIPFGASVPLRRRANPTTITRSAPPPIHHASFGTFSIRR